MQTVSGYLKDKIARWLGISALVHPITGENLAELLGQNYTTDSGVSVNADTARKVSAVFACNRLLSGAVAGLPKQIFQRDNGGGREQVTWPAEYRLLQFEPSPIMSAFVYWQTVIGQIHFYGNSYSLIDRLGNGLPDRIWLLDPRSVSVKRKDGHFEYIVQLTEGGSLTVDQDDILDFPNIFFDVQSGRGLSTIRGGAQSIGLSLAAEAHSARFFKNGAVPSVAIQYPAGARMSKDMQDQVREYWKEKHGGENAHMPAVLTEGGDVKTLTMSAEDAQLLQAREFQVADIARLFGVPPWMIGAVEKTTSWGTGIEQQSIGFVTYTLKPLLTLIEQEINRKLFYAGRLFFEFNVSGLLRGDVKTRNEAYRIARGGNQEPGYMTINEIRKLENLPPIPGGDELYRPTANTGSADNEQAADAAA